jgi:tRNA 2-thiouridine synthesizing protein C
MATADRPRLLVVIRHTPYGSGLARASLDAALAAAAFDQPIQVLFMGDGVLQLVPGQDSSAIGLRNIARLLGSFPLYDIEHVYIDEEAAGRLGVDPSKAPLPTRTLNAAGIHALMDSCDHLLSF